MSPASFPPRPEPDGGRRSPGASGPYPDTPRPGTAADLTSESLLRPTRRAPGEGWRRAVFAASGGLINPGESRGERRRRELREQVRTPTVSGHHRIAVLSMRSGVGRTTTAVGIGSVLAEERGDRVIAVETAPGRGTLPDRLPAGPRTVRTIRDLVAHRDTLRRYADVRAYTSQAPSRLEFLTSGADPDRYRVLSDGDYRHLTRIVERFYSVCVTDCGVGVLHPAMAAILTAADQAVLVCAPSVGGARDAVAALDWLVDHGYARLARDSVTVLSRVDRAEDEDLDRVEEYLSPRCRRVLRVPEDPYLAEGGPVDPARLRPATRLAHLEVAAEIAAVFR